MFQQWIEGFEREWLRALRDKRLKKSHKEKSLKKYCTLNKW